MTNKELKEKIARLETELAEVKKQVAALPKRVNGVFKPEYKQEYWYISRKADNDWWEDHSFDHDRYAIGNCFPTKQAAEDVVRVLKLTQKARETQNGFVPDWEDSTRRKYSLYFDRVEICITSYLSLNIAPAFGFWENKSECEQFIKNNHDELIWFFKEYLRRK